MINNNKRLGVYFDSLINNVFKILPLYEEGNDGVESYIDSLIFQLEGLDSVIKIDDSDKYLKLLTILASVKKEILKSDSKHSVVRRELFNCISVIRSLMGKLGEGE